MDSLPEEVVYILKSVAEGRASELERVGLPSDYAEFTVSRNPRGGGYKNMGIVTTCVLPGCKGSALVLSLWNRTKTKQNATAKGLEKHLNSTRHWDALGRVSLSHNTQVREMCSSCNNNA